MSDTTYWGIADEIIAAARRLTGNPYVIYEQAKKQHLERIGYIAGDGRYEQFIQRLIDALGL